MKIKTNLPLFFLFDEEMNSYNVLISYDGRLFTITSTRLNQSANIAVDNKRGYRFSVLVKESDLAGIDFIESIEYYRGINIIKINNQMIFNCVESQFNALEIEDYQIIQRQPSNIVGCINGKLKFLSTPQPKNKKDKKEAFKKICAIVKVNVTIDHGGFVKFDDNLYYISDSHNTAELISSKATTESATTESTTTDRQYRPDGSMVPMKGDRVFQTNGGIFSNKTYYGIVDSVIDKSKMRIIKEWKTTKSGGISRMTVNIDQWTVDEDPQIQKDIDQAKRDREIEKQIAIENKEKAHSLMKSAIDHAIASGKETFCFYPNELKIGDKIASYYPNETTGSYHKIIQEFTGIEESSWEDNTIYYMVKTIKYKTEESDNWLYPPIEERPTVLFCNNDCIEFNKAKKYTKILSD